MVGWRFRLVPILAGRVSNFSRSVSVQGKVGDEGLHQPQMYTPGGARQKPGAKTLPGPTRPPDLTKVAAEKSLSHFTDQQTLDRGHRKHRNRPERRRVAIGELKVRAAAIESGDMARRR